MKNSGFKKKLTIPLKRSAFKFKTPSKGSKRPLGRTKRVKIGKSITPAKLKSKLDQIFSLDVRLSYADNNGMVACYTCGTIKHYKEIQCGHFEKRHNLCTRWLEENCRPQCVACNVFRDGNYPEFSYRLNKENPNLLEHLHQQKNKVCKFSPDQMKEMIYLHQCRVNIFLKKLSN